MGFVPLVIYEFKKKVLLIRFWDPVTSLQASIAQYNVA